MNIIGGTILLAAGCTLIIIRKRFARDGVAFQNKAFGLHFGEKEIKVNEWLSLLIGSIFIVLGILALLGIYKLKLS